MSAGPAADGVVRVMVWLLDPADDPGAVERAYHQISDKLLGTEGLLGNSLMRAPGAEDGRSAYLVVSEWANMSAFLTWEQGADHRGTTSPLRPYQDPDRRPAMYAEVAGYGPDGLRAGTRAS